MEYDQNDITLQWYGSLCDFMQPTGWRHEIFTQMKVKNGCWGVKGVYSAGYLSFAPAAVLSTLFQPPVGWLMLDYIDEIPWLLIYSRVQLTGNKDSRSERKREVRSWYLFSEMSAQADCDHAQLKGVFYTQLLPLQVYKF